MKGERKKNSTRKIWGENIQPGSFAAEIVKNGPAFTERFNALWEQIPEGIRAKATARDLAELAAMLDALHTKAESLIREIGTTKVAANVRLVETLKKQAEKIGAFFDVRRSRVPSVSLAASRIIADVKLWGRR